MSASQKPQLPNLRFLQTRGFTPHALLTDTEKRNAIPQARQWFSSAATSLRARLRLCEELIEALEEVDRGLGKIEGSGELHEANITAVSLANSEAQSLPRSRMREPMPASNGLPKATSVIAHQTPLVLDSHDQVRQGTQLLMEMQLELDKVTQYLSRVKVLRGQWMAGNKI